MLFIYSLLGSFTDLKYCDICTTNDNMNRKLIEMFCAEHFVMKFFFIIHKYTTYICNYICIYVYMYKCIYMYIHTNSSAYLGEQKMCLLPVLAVWKLRVDLGHVGYVAAVVAKDQGFSQG
jgi:hypothetical protein